MEYFSKKDVQNLLQQRGKGPSVSLYMPTLKGVPGSRDNPIRFKNLVAKSEEELAAWGLSSLERREILEPAQQLVNDSHFWGNQSKGFASFLSAGFFRSYRLPVEFDEMAVVKNSFYFKPLFSLLAADGQFYVLALSKKDARLLMGTRGMVEEMDLSETIRKFEETFGFELPQQYLQFHTKAPAVGGMRMAMFHGHGGEVDSVQAERLRKYFRFIDGELPQLLDQRNAPLVLACVDHLAPLYREVSKYPILLEQGIRGNPENITAQELHREAWKIVEPYFHRKREEARSRYYDLRGTGKTSTNLSEIVPASFHGRINDLFVALGKQQWGWYHKESQEVEWHEGPRPDSEELLDLAATETFINNGNVFAVDPGQMPETEPAAAIFRW